MHYSSQMNRTPRQSVAEIDSFASSAQPEREDAELSNVMQARRAAQVGDIETIRYLLDNNLVTADATDSDDWYIDTSIQLLLRNLVLCCTGLPSTTD